MVGKFPKRRAYKKRSSKKTVKLSTPMKKAIRKIAQGPVETKYVMESLWNDNKFNSLIGETLAGVVVQDWYRCIPKVPQGVSSYNRLGNKIQPIKCELDVLVKFDVTDYQSRDVYAVFYMLTVKASPTYQSNSIQQPYPSTAYTFLDTGNGNKINYNGTWLATQYPVDTEGFTLHYKKIFRLHKPSGNPNGAGVVPPVMDLSGNPLSIHPLGSGAGGTGLYASGGAIRHQFKVRVPLPKTLQFDTESAQTPSNAGPVWGIGYYYSDGTAADTGTNGLLKMSAITKMFYKDA